MPTSRERVEAALNHEEPDRVPIDLGGTSVTSMHAATVYKLRQALGLDEPGTPVKVVEEYQMLGEIGPDLLEAVGGDVVGVSAPTGMFGFKYENWKPWTFWDGTPLLVPGDFNTDPEPDGGLLMYPQGDKTCKPTGRMPEGSFYFDSIVEQSPIDEDELNVEDNLDEFGPVSDEVLEYYRAKIDYLWNQTDKAIVASFGGSSFGDIALVPAIWLKDRRGIRGVEEWYMSMILRKDYILEIFERQCEIALDNLTKFYEVVGDKPCAVFVTGTDFGAQQGPFISPEAYKEMFQPFHVRVNEWIHTHTKWRSFIHSCGSVLALIPHFIDAGFEVLNPVQTSAVDMDPFELKEKFGDSITFWGGGVDTQKTLPFGTPDEVRAEVRERIHAFGPSGGFVFSPIHNVQAKTPPENLIAMYETVREYGGYEHGPR
jgi:hypothetical protein